MDDLENFEMKPLTTGLGFQKDSAPLRSSMAKSDVVSRELNRHLPPTRPDGLLEVPKARSSDQILSEIKDALKPFGNTPSKTDLKLTETLPRTGSAQRTSDMETEIPRRDPLADINFQIPQGDLQSPTLGARRGAADSLVREWVPLSFSAPAAILDAFIILAVSMIFLVGLISATQVDLVSVLTSAQADIPAQVSLLVLYLAMSQMYLIVSRSFAGSSVGEWTFDIQAGRSEQIPQATYPLRIFVRSLVTLLTGVFVLPLLSLALKRDLAGSVSGVQLYRRNI